MKRRSFLASIPLMAAAIKVFSKEEPKPESGVFKWVEFRKKYPLTYEEAFRINSAEVLSIIKITDSHYMLEITGNNVIGKLNGQLCMDERNCSFYIVNTFTYVYTQNGYNHWIEPGDTDWNKKRIQIEVRTISSAQEFKLKPGDQIVFYANAAAER